MSAGMTFYINHSEYLMTEMLILKCHTLKLGKRPLVYWQVGIGIRHYYSFYISTVHIASFSFFPNEERQYMEKLLRSAYLC